MSADGKALADFVGEEVGFTSAIRRTCDALCRATVTWGRYALDSCNGHPANAMPSIPAETATELQEALERRIERGQARIARRVQSLIRDLPEPDGGGRWAIHLEGDPRGASWIEGPSGRRFYMP